MPELGDAPIESGYERMMNAIVGILDRFFNGDGDRKTGFVLMVFPYGNEDGRCNYISNGADRGDVVKLMREQIRHFENDA